MIAQRLAEGAQSAFHQDRGGDNVGGVAPLELPEGRDSDSVGAVLRLSSAWRERWMCIPVLVGSKWCGDGLYGAFAFRMTR